MEKKVKFKISDYEIYEQVGKGAYADIFVGRNTKDK